jgi:uncharacterized membrane protein
LNDTVKHRRWTVIASGLLCGILAVVVLFTNRSAFASPMAVVVVAAIGSVAVLLRVRLRNGEGQQETRGPIWLNLLGIVLALIALFSDLLHLSSGLTQIAALGAIGSFAVSSAVVLHTFRKQRFTSK